MQYRTLRRVVLSFMVMIVAVGSLTLLGCGGGDDNGATTRTINTTIPLNATTADAGVPAVLNGKTFVVSSGELANDTQAAPALKTALAAQTTTTVSFSGISGRTGNFSTTNPTTSGTVTFTNSCTFTVNTPGLTGTIFVQNCSITITGAADVGGDVQDGALTLNFNGNVSLSVTVQVQINANGVLIVDGISTGITISGTSGG